MIARVLRFIQLPILTLVIYTVVRFSLGVGGMPYAPRGNAMASVLGLAIISSLYFGALSGRIGRFSWGGTVLVGYFIGLSAQILIFSATVISYTAGFETSYFRHWDALNVPPGTIVPMAKALQIRAQGLLVGPIVAIIPALVGRLLSALAPKP